MTNQKRKAPTPQLDSTAILIGLEEAASLVGTSVDSYRRLFSKSPSHPKPRFIRPMRWLREEVIDWIKGPV